MFVFSARATFAAPTYYRPFPHEPSKQTYIDGGVWHNNPVAIADSERKLIWPDAANMPPDILLSIGSGYCLKLTSSMHSSRNSARLGVGSNLKAMYRNAVDHVHSSVDSEKAWRGYIERLLPLPEQRFRYRRLNIELDEAPPKLDDFESMEGLEEETRRQWSLDERIQYVAQHLVATIFYFEKTRVEHLEDDSYICSGMFHDLRSRCGAHYSPKVSYSVDYFRDRKVSVILEDIYATVSWMTTVLISLFRKNPNSLEQKDSRLVTKSSAT